MKMAFENIIRMIQCVMTTSQSNKVNKLPNKKHITNGDCFSVVVMTATFSPPAFWVWQIVIQKKKVACQPICRHTTSNSTHRKPLQFGNFMEKALEARNSL